MVQAEFSGPGHAPNQMGHSISFEDVCALHLRDLNFHIHHFYWKFASKETMQEITFRLEQTCHLK